MLDASTAWAASPCVTAATSAQDLRAAGKLRDARVALLACAKASCNTVIRSDCEKWLKELDEQMPSIVIRAVDARGRDVPGAQITIDDTPTELDGSPIVVDPGQHVIRAKAKSGETAELRSLVALGEKARVLEVRFEAQPAGDPPPRETKTREVEPAPPATESTGSGKIDLLPIALAGAGAIALGVFTVFELKGQSDYSDLENGCYRLHTCTADNIDPVRTEFIAAGVALGVSVVALAAAALVYFSGHAATAKPARGAVRERARTAGFSF